jgi:hypothetical protein
MGLQSGLERPVHASMMSGSWVCQIVHHDDLCATRAAEHLWTSQ